MSGMEIERVGRTNNFSIIPNEIFDHKEMSWRATGILAYLLSRPDWWKSDVDRLAASHKEGREAVRTAMHELEAVGYVRRTKTRNAGGQWVHKMQIFEIPQPPVKAESIPDQDVADMVEPEPN